MYYRTQPVNNGGTNEYTVPSSGEGIYPDMGAYNSGGKNAQIRITGPMKITKDEEVTFEAHIHGDIEPQEVCWQFGDGKCGSQVSHAYSKVYDYGIRVRVVDSDGRKY